MSFKKENLPNRETYSNTTPPDLRQFRRRACAQENSLQKATLLAMLPADTGIGRYFHNLDINSWEIVSFSAYTKEACISIINPKGNKTISIIVPQITNDGKKNNVPYG